MHLRMNPILNCWENFSSFLWLGNRRRALTVDSAKPRAKPLNRLNLANSQQSNNFNDRLSTVNCQLSTVWRVIWNRTGAGQIFF
ncbi:MAG: hypothetical protein HC786_21740 [Richelia sp. CSU_2_1]|nr:hypothetical protein [Microcoleus sp. SM1_3_4]NJR24590.1 hypothetical protein [Richelia sp. CSU_2_1]